VSEPLAWLTPELEKALDDVIDWLNSTAGLALTDDLDEAEGLRRLAVLSNELIVAGIK
jgi:hypothetical protein